MSYTLIDNKDEKQYEFHVEGHIAKIEYVKQPDKIYLIHTEVTESLEGKGVGSALVKQVLDDIREKELKLVPLCPFVAAYLKRHPEYNTLVENA